MTWRRDTTDERGGFELRAAWPHRVEEHRGHVVRRLLMGGIGAETLRRILPEWTGLIDDTVASLDRDAAQR